MLEEFVKQVRRLFSSKSNGGKLVYSLANRVHYYMQVLLALSIILLLGYSNFRLHFVCQPVGTLDMKTVTNFCWLNGTTTLDIREGYKGRGKIGGSSQIPHIGMNFKTNERTGKYELVNHNYMRGLWTLLILMAICSYLAQRQWSSIFENDLMKALLKLPKSEELELVKKAQAGKGYQVLKQLADEENLAAKTRKKFILRMSKIEQLEHSIEIIEGDQNLHNNVLEYYPNQLIYLLLAARSPSNQLPSGSLRKRLICYSLSSLLFTCLQFIIPWLFIGPKYSMYGWRIAKAALAYLLKQLVRPRSDINSFDYALSSSIWPISTACEYTQYGLGDTESVTVQCTVSINEICAKLFAVIWWVVVIHIVIELYNFIWIIVSSVCFSSSEFCFGLKAWPSARNEAKQLAKFRYRRALILEKREKRSSSFLSIAGDNNIKGLSGLDSNEPDKRSKLLEAEADRATSKSAQKRPKKWYLWCTRDIGLLLSEQWKRINAPTDDIDAIKAKNRSDTIKEPTEDQNILYLLYLLYLRLDRSKKSIEQIIRMTNDALTKYLDKISNQLEESDTVGKVEVNNNNIRAKLDEGVKSVTEVDQNEQSLNKVTLKEEEKSASAPVDSMQ